VRQLLVVEQAFGLEGRGTILAPELLLGDQGTYELTIEVRRPDGTRETCAAKAAIPFFDPPQLDRSPAHVLIVSLPKERVPVGTEVWLVSDVL
jgi:hypothetical protein